MWMCVTLLVGFPALCKGNYCLRKDLDMSFWKTGTHLVLLESSPHSTFQLLYMAGIVLQLWYVAFSYSTLYFLPIFGATMQEKWKWNFLLTGYSPRCLVYPWSSTEQFFHPHLIQKLIFQIYQNFGNECLNRNSRDNRFKNNKLFRCAETVCCGKVRPQHHWYQWQQQKLWQESWRPMEFLVQFAVSVLAAVTLGRPWPVTPDSLSCLSLEVLRLDTRSACSLCNYITSHSTLCSFPRSRISQNDYRT